MLSLIFTSSDPLIIFLLPASTTLNSADLEVVVWENDTFTWEHENSSVELDIENYLATLSHMIESINKNNDNEIAVLTKVINSNYQGEIMLLLLLNRRQCLEPSR